jgi:hypothetical protein
VLAEVILDPGLAVVHAVVGDYDDFVFGLEEFFCAIAEWKFWFGEKRSSTFWCKLVLFSVTVTCLFFATLIITRWNRKVS